MHAQLVCSMVGVPLRITPKCRDNGKYSDHRISKGLLVDMPRDQLTLRGLKYRKICQLYVEPLMLFPSLLLFSACTCPARDWCGCPKKLISNDLSLHLSLREANFRMECSLFPSRHRLLFGVLVLTHFIRDNRCNRNITTNNKR